MTDENYLLFQFGQDLATKGFMFLQQKRQINEILKSIGAATTSEYAQPAPPPQQESEPSQYSQTIVEENDYEDLPKEPSFDNVEIIDAENNSQPLSPDMIILPKRPKGNAKGRKSTKNNFPFPASSVPNFPVVSLNKTPGFLNNDLPGGVVSFTNLLKFLINFES